MWNRFRVKLLRSKWGMVFQLATATVWWTPTNYIDAPRTSLPKIKLWGALFLPLIPAAFWGFACVGLLDWEFALQMQNHAAPTFDIVQRMHSMDVFIKFGSGAVMAVIFHWLALARWALNFSFVAILRRLGFVVRRLPWRYFVITTCSAALWLGVLGEGMVWLLWHSAGRPESYIESTIAIHQSTVVVFGVALTAINSLITKRLEQGQKEFYGSSYKAMKWVEFIGMLFVIAAMVAFTYVFGHHFRG
jgi:hypothetical protein